MNFKRNRCQHNLGTSVNSSLFNHSVPLALACLSPFHVHPFPGLKYQTVPSIIWHQKSGTPCLHIFVNLPLLHKLTPITVFWHSPVNSSCHSSKPISSSIPTLHRQFSVFQLPPPPFQPWLSYDAFVVTTIESTPTGEEMDHSSHDWNHFTKQGLCGVGLNLN